MRIPALFGIPLSRLAQAIYGAVRARSLVILRRQIGPAWDDPLQDHCPRIDHSDPRAGNRCLVIAADQRHDLVRYLLADTSRRPASARPRIVIVVRDPSSREEFAVRAQDWRAIFDVGFELYVPDNPPAPVHLERLCRRLSARGAVLLIPAEAIFRHDAWQDEAFRTLDRDQTEGICWSVGNPALDDAARVPVAGWRRGASQAPAVLDAHTTQMDAGATGQTEPTWAPIATERLPAVTSQTSGFNLQGRLYRHKEAILSVAARMLICVGLPRHRSYAQVQACFFIPAAGWFITGSIVDPFRAISGITLAHPTEPCEIDLSDHWSRVPQPMLDRLYRQFHLPEPPRGFVALVPLEVLGASARPSTLRFFEHRGPHRRLLRVHVQELEPGIDSLQTLLGSFSPDKVRLPEFMLRQAAPAVEVLWGQHPARALSRGAKLTDVMQRIGSLPDAPRVSIVVPIYGRWDFMRYQMASFGGDPTLHNAEWIYVLDDPRISDRIDSVAGALHAVFGVPFTLVNCGANLGFSGACNLGARTARAPLLLLMNSDVFPVADGWIEPMIDALVDDVGAVGARLLYEDNAVQHAGLAFEPYGAWRGLNIITHPHKGLPDRLLPAADGCSAGTTAACMLMRRSDYSAIGGLSERYAIGDFEDGDLCARLRAVGKRVVTTSLARLYHLERQSIRTLGDTRWREMLTLYNCSLFNRRIKGFDDGAFTE